MTEREYVVRLWRGSFRVYAGSVEEARYAGVATIVEDPSLLVPQLIGSESESSAEAYRRRKPAKADEKGIA